MDIENTPLHVFDEQVIETLAGISDELLKSPIVRQYPDLAAFAFYIRKANVLKLRDAHFASSELQSRLGRGLCFHVAPGNIPVNFAFSWVFAILAGNANIVRLPSKAYPQVDALVNVIRRHLDKNPDLAIRNVFVRYPRNDTDQTAKYCAISDCRMIWGGDRTIAAIKALPTSPRCVDIGFADRYSLAIIDAAAVLSADETTIRRLADGFYNDTWLMDQNACSSPQLICWVNDSSEGRKRFWNAAEMSARAKYSIQDAVAVDKLSLLCEEAATNPACREVSRSDNLLYREELLALTPDVINRRGKAGYFFEYSLATSVEKAPVFPELFSILNQKVQTITYFGFDAVLLRRSLIAAHVRGVDRIVPIGQAMDIGIVWDGHDLVRELSRVIML